MLLSDAEIKFDFGNASFDLERDREALGWIFNQFLYGEVTGIQVGHWIYNAPDLERAQFLVRQCAQELSHVRIMRSIFDRLDVQPQAAHPIVKFVSTGMMGANWDEHVCLEMALGEGYVLTVFYALIDLIPDPHIQRLLRIAARQEASHVSFGEEQTQLAARRPAVQRRLLGLSLVSLSSAERLARIMAKRMQPDHTVFRQLPEFAEHTVRVSELRLQRMGILECNLSQLSRWKRWRLIAEGMGTRLLAPLRRRRKRITATYLQDPLLAWQPPRR